MQVVFLTRARADLDRLRQFLAPHGEQLSQRAVDTLFAAARSLRDLPERGRPAAKPGYRELVVPFGRGAYVIRYRIDQQRDTVVIVRLWHGRENR
ncbi:MAG TPA: type II toxin-antitoxin system RelE/ParE family toxin [Xanthobacteraceae bacterium]|nr:type II toxin-antitoxin system RelE/ParE family toxin [Xanthobacteraceae bacterium]